jgi:hypothetical protein
MRSAHNLVENFWEVHHIGSYFCKNNISQSLKKSPRFAKIKFAVTWDFSNLGPKVPGDRIFDFFEPGTAGS